MRLLSKFRPSPAMVIACLALLIALGGTGYAAVQALPRNSVTTVQVKDFSLLARDFKRGQLPRGAQGLPGPAGGVGPAGPQGPAGPAGTANMKWALVRPNGSVAAQSGGISVGAHPSAGNYLVNLGSAATGKAVVATGGTHLNCLADLAFITVYFPNKVVAHINVNWLSPVKVRTTLIGGEKKMLVWNDLEADEKIKVYDKGVQITNGQSVYELLVSYRSGDVWAPRVEQAEALKLELEYFMDCIRNDRTPFNDGLAGLRVVKLLEAADQSLKERGKIVRL